MVGDYTLTLDVPKHSEELLADNNQLSAPIAIREEKLRVLIVESVHVGNTDTCEMHFRVIRVSRFRASSFIPV